MTPRSASQARRLAIQSPGDDERFKKFGELIGSAMELHEQFTSTAPTLGNLIREVRVRDLTRFPTPAELAELDQVP